MQKFSRGDYLFFAVCALLFAGCLVFALTNFDSAFPEASIDFRYDRTSSITPAEGLLAELGIATKGRMHAAQFGSDDRARIYLERTVGLTRANTLMKSDVRVWRWSHRWFRPLDPEEIQIDVAPTGEVVAFEHKLPEERPAAQLAGKSARQVAEEFLTRRGINVSQLTFVSESQKRLPKRIDTILSWDRRIAGLAPPYRYTVVLHGGEIGSFTQRLRVPDAWTRDYVDLRSKNNAAGAVDSIFFVLTAIAALAVFLVRLRNGDIQVRFTIITGIVCAVLVTLVAFNSFPDSLADYDVQTSFSAFLTKEIVFSILNGIAVGLFLMVIVASGEALYRERFGRHLAAPRFLSAAALTSRRAFKSFILGYTLVALFLAYQVAFYMVAAKYGAWAPAEVPYDGIVNTVMPWVAVLFIGFFPAFSEEFMSRAFSIPFFERLFRSRIVAVLLAAYIWGFGHAAYPNQPFFIRGVEVGTAGVLIGIVLYRYGLMPLLVWHYTVDATYTALLLFRSHNTYYIVSAGIASFIFVVPMILSLVLYFRRGGFVDDTPLQNDAIGTATAVSHGAEEPAAPLPPPIPVVRRDLAVLGAAALIAAGLFALIGGTRDTVTNYRIGKDEAISIARNFLVQRKEAIPQKKVAMPSAGFRDWDEEDRSTDGGSPGHYDSIAADYIAEHSKDPDATLRRIQSGVIEASTWKVRFFTPKEKDEEIVEIDPRTSHVIGFTHEIAEDSPGATIDRASAEAIARAEFSRFNLRQDAFVLKDALSFQQPKRRDWLLHFEEKTPLAASAFRRVDVRIAGNRVVHFGKTVKIPDEVRREATRTTFLNTVLLIARIAAVIAILVIAIVGFVTALRDRPFRWKFAARFSGYLLIPAAAAMLCGIGMIPAKYETRINWDTFLILAVVSVIGMMLFELLLSFVATLSTDTIHPYARKLFTRDGRAAFGRSAAVAAVSAVLIVLAYAELVQLAARWFPQLRGTFGGGVSDSVAIPLPSVRAIWQSLFATLIGCAGIASIAHFVSTSKRRTAMLALVIGAFTIVLVDHSGPLSDLPLNVVVALGAVLVMTFVVLKVLRANPLAYPLTFFSMAMIQDIGSLIRNDRLDLRLNSAFLGLIVIAVFAWAVAPRPPAESPAASAPENFTPVVDE